jgi:general secretion pathway protein J
MRPLRQRGFTLIELLVAIAILAIVAVMGWRGLDSITRSRAILTQQLEQSRGMQLAFAQMQSDLEHLTDATLLNERSNLSADNNRLTIVRTVYADNEAVQVQVVAYRLADGVLTRRESIATRDLSQLDAMWQAALSDTDVATPVVLQGGVDSMSMRVFENQGWSASVGSLSVQAPGTAAMQSQLTASATIPPAALAALAAKAATNAASGLEVTLLLRGDPAGLVKVFLLGAV